MNSPNLAAGQKQLISHRAIKNAAAKQIWNGRTRIKARPRKLSLKFSPAPKTMPQRSQ
jgi:hypothetical protein